MGRPKKEAPVEDESVIELDSTVALEQAGNALLMATEKANYNNDVEALLKIAGGWMEIHEYLAGVTQHHNKSPLGFTSIKAEREEEEVEELDDAIADTEGRSTQSIGFRGLHPQHGKL